jgi:uncharacterized protein (TIGR03435 family)
MKRLFPHFGLVTTLLPIALSIVGAASVTRAQQIDTPGTVSFEVGSVKASTGRAAGGAFEITHERLSIRNMDIGHAIMRAYSISERQFASVGKWLPILAGRYDIDAKAAHSVSRADMMRMLQGLLAERFQLAVHRETKEVSGYALLVDKDGPKLREHVGNGAECTYVRAQKGELLELQFRNCSMQSFAAEPLGPWVREIVADQTGLKATYDFEFLAGWDLPANPMEGGSEARVFNPGAPSIFTAVKQQLGLRLQPQKLNVEMLSIDHVERPSEN